MILRHRNLDLLRFEWTESCGVCISWINDTARQFLPLAFDHVSYGLAMFKGRLCSTCPIFTSEKIGYLPASNLENRASALGDPRFAPIFLFDALIFNTDRHLGNFGYLVDNATNTVCGVAPIFDNGYGLFSLAADDSLLTSLRGRHPALFDSWLAFPGALNESLLTALRRLEGFRFKRHQHYNLPAERLDRIQRILQKRVSDILEYGKDADKYIQIADGRAGVNSKGGVGCVGVNTEDLDPLALQILWNMKANPFVTARELAEVLSVEQRTIERRIRTLREKNVIRRAGEDKTGHWQVLV